MSSPRNTLLSGEYPHDEFSSMIGQNTLDDDVNQAGSNLPRQFPPVQNEEVWIRSTIDQTNLNLGEKANNNANMNSNIDRVASPSMS